MSKKPRYSIFILGLTLLLAVVVIGLTFYQGAADQGTNQYLDYIEQFEKELDNPYLSAESRDSLEIKLRLVRMEATRHALRFSGPEAWAKFPKDTLQPLPSGPASTLPDGIDNDPIIPRPLPSYETVSAIVNAWRKHTPDHYYLVLAGYVTTEPVQGMVLVFQPKIPAFNRYLTPKKSGAVRVVEEHGFYLVLKAENGDVYYFDAYGERFIDSLDAPTITPTPDNLLLRATPGPPYPSAILSMVEF